MKTEELKALGLNDDQIKEVFRLHGLVVNEYKDLENDNKVLTAEKENLITQLNTANQKIEEFTEMDIEGIKQEAANYKQKYEESANEREVEIANLKKDFSIEKALLNAEVKNAKAVKALLNMDELNQANNFEDALNAQISTLKESDAYLFKDSPLPNSVGGTGNPQPPKENMTYSEMMEFLDKNPGAKI